MVEQFLWTFIVYGVRWHTVVCYSAPEWFRFAPTLSRFHDGCPFCNCLICRCSTGRMQEPGLLQGKTNGRSNNQYRTLHLQRGPMTMCPSVSWLPRLQGWTCPAGPDLCQRPHPLDQPRCLPTIYTAGIRYLAVETPFHHTG
jgi:hypothetical protein